MPFEVGQRVNDYEILHVLGAGGMGRVYCVRNVISQRVEAMKVLLPDLSAEPELANRFIGEIRTLASFDHPNIAQLHTAFQVDNQLVMIMEYIEGFTLDQRAKQGPISVDEVLGYITQVLSALSYAHSRGIVHRDMKPSNMMVTPHGVVKVMDFGIAKSATDPHATRPGTTLGSLYYMSPEQVRGSGVDARSDLYSVGISLYELSAGRKPFQADTTFDVLNQQLNVAPQPPTEYNPNLPPALNDIILTALAKDPMQRFQSADAFRNALQTVKTSLGAASVRTQTAAPAGSPPSANAASAPAVPGAPSAQAPKGNRGLWMAIGAVALLCVLAAGALVLPRYFHAGAASASPAVKAEAIHALQQTTAPANNIPPPGEAKAQGEAQTERTAPISGAGEPIPSKSASALNKSDSESTFHARPTPPRSAQTRPPAEPAASGSTATQAEMQTQVPGSGSERSEPHQRIATAPTAPSQEEMDQLNERMIQLGARANGAKASVERLRSEQAASGLGLRQDITSSMSRMEAYMEAADRSTQSGNVSSARKNMDQAEKEIERLEAFCGR
jgi:eukaryotic-like serine/threonine-protein kinase